ncbi:MAG: caspase family protein [Verrucomicrobiia bacterium]
MRPSHLFPFLAILPSLLIAEGPLQWDPDKTSVFIVGTLEWQDAETFAPFPKDNRRDAQLVAWFKKQGVPDNRIVYLQDRQATLQTIRQSLRQLLHHTAPGDQLILYYCGHGYLSENDPSLLLLASYDAGIGSVEGWSLRDIAHDLAAHFSGDRTTLILDCCHSGGAIPAFRRHLRDASAAILASSTTAETSTGNWTFTEGILRALNGEPVADTNRDGTITLAELFTFLTKEMRFAEDQTAAFHQQHHWTPTTPFARAKPAPHPDVGAHALIQAEGEEWKGRILAVQPDRYQVFYYGYETSDIEWVEPSRVRILRE